MFNLCLNRNEPATKMVIYMEASRISKTFQKLADKQSNLEYQRNQLVKIGNVIELLEAEYEALEGEVLMHSQAMELLTADGIRSINNRVMKLDPELNGSIVFSPVVIGSWELKDE